MKKILILFALLSISPASISAADFYLTGMSKKWTLEQDLKFTQNNNVYTLHLDNVAMSDFSEGFKVAESNWASQYGTKDSFVFGESMTCVEGDGNNFYFPYGVTSVAGLTLTFDMTDAVSPKLTAMPDLYLAGEITDWSNTNSDYRFSENNGTYTLAVNNLSGKFRIAGGTTPEWALEYGGSSDMTAGNIYDCIAGPGNDMSLGSEMNVILTFDYSSKKLTVTERTSVTINEDLYLAHDIDGTWWSNHPDFKFTRNGNRYTLHLDDLPEEFKITTSDWGVQLGALSEFVFGSPMVCIDGWGNNFVRPAQYETIAGALLTLDLSNSSLPTLTVMPDLYLAGEMTGGETGWWNANPAYRFSENNGVYTLAVSDLTGEFKIAAGTSPEWALEYGGPSNMTAGNTYDCVEGAGNMTLASEMNVLLTFDLASKTLTVTERSEISVDEDLYLAHDIDGTWWSNHPDFKFTKNGDKYTLHLDDLPEAFKITTSDWEVQLGAMSEFAFETPMMCVDGWGNDFLRPTEYETIAGVLLVLDMTDKAFPTLTVMPDLYLAGEITGWSNTNSDYRFSENNGSYTLAVSNLTGKFRIAGGTTPEWAVQYGGAENMSAGNSYQCISGSGNDMSLSSAMDVIMTFDLSSKTLAVTERQDIVVDGDLYLAHDIDGTWWSNHPDFKFTQNGNKYTLHLDDIPDEFKITTSDWGVELGCMSDFVFGSPMPCINGWGNNFVRPAEYETIAGVLLTLDMSDASLPRLTVTPDLYLAGEMTGGDSGWWNANPAYRFSENNGVYTLAVSELTGDFKIAAGTSPQWALEYGGQKEMTVGSTYDCVVGSVGNMSVAGGSLKNAFITFDRNNMKVTVSSLSASEFKDDLYLAGAINGWASDNDDYKFSRSGNVFTLTVPRLTGEFKVVSKDWSLQFGCASLIETGQVYSCILSGNDYNMRLADDGAAEITLVFDLDNLTIEAEGMPRLYLVGDFNSWTPTSAYAFSYNNGVYTLITAEFSGAFKVETVDKAVSFGIDENPWLDTDRNYSVTHGAGNMSFGSRSRSVSRVLVTLTPDGVADDEVSTGIDAANTDTDPNVEYYNLQGMRIDCPAHGVYIRKTGNVIEKVLVK